MELFSRLFILIFLLTHNFSNGVDDSNIYEKIKSTFLDSLSGSGTGAYAKYKKARDQLVEWWNDNESRNAEFKKEIENIAVKGYSYELDHHIRKNKTRSFENGTYEEHLAICNEVNINRRERKPNNTDIGTLNIKPEVVNGTIALLISDEQRIYDITGLLCCHMEDPIQTYWVVRVLKEFYFVLYSIPQDEEAMLLGMAHNVHARYTTLLKKTFREWFKNQN